MIEGLQRYSEYKKSDIPWARVLPSNWQTERAKRLFTKMQRPVRPEDEVVTCFRDGRVTLRKNRRLRGFTEATAFSGYQGIRKGDLVIHGMDAFAGAIGVSDSDGKGTPVYNVCKPNPGIVADYYAHTVREMSRAQWILALAKGIRERSTDFRYETFGNQFVPLPPPDEQAAIVRFLEHANRKIDGFIRAKRKLIGLLSEQKQAIIHRAVTRGLDPHAPLKPSGIPWLGDIPKHWQILRLKQLARPGVNTFTDGDWIEAPFITSSGVRLIQTGNIGVGVYREQGFRYISEQTCQRFNCALIDPGDVLICRLGDPVARACLAPDLGVPMITSVDVCILKVDAKVCSQFLVYLMSNRQFLGWVSSIVRGSTRDRVSRSMLGRFPVQFPSITEQNEIKDYLDTETASFTTAIARTEREIALMQEYRTRLTADVVTGKLDVRPAAARLPAAPLASAQESGEATEPELEETDADA